MKPALVLVCCAWGTLVLQAPVEAQHSPETLLNTYSIVARDAQTGELGVAVQSHWFQVGVMVPWAQAGVGAVATQALTNPAFGPRGLELLAAGKSPAQALAQLLAEDPQAANRQLAIVDAKGRVAVHSGSRCLPAAGHQQGPGFAVQANLMRHARVWPAMARAYGRSKGPLAERLLAALAAAERQGGDLRGAQSAALLVVAPSPSGKPWQDRRVDLRVADHPRPVQELSRLLRLRRAYDAWSAGEQALAAGQPQQAAASYQRAQTLAPRRQELRFWQGLSLFSAGQQRRGAALLRPLVGTGSPWRLLLERLPAGGLLSAEQLTTLQQLLRRPASRQQGGKP